MKRLVRKKLKIMKKVTEEDIRRRKDFHVRGIGGINVVLKSIKILTQFFTKLGKAIFSSTWKHTKTRRAKTILNHERTARGITIPDLILYYRAIITTVLAQQLKSQK